MRSRVAFVSDGKPRNFRRRFMMRLLLPVSPFFLRRAFRGGSPRARVKSSSAVSFSKNGRFRPGRRKSALLEGRWRVLLGGLIGWYPPNSRFARLFRGAAFPPLARAGRAFL